MSRNCLFLYSTIEYMKRFVHLVKQDLVINNHTGRYRGRGADLFVQMRERRVWQRNYETIEDIGPGSPSEAGKPSQKYSLPFLSLA